MVFIFLIVFLVYVETNSEQIFNQHLTQINYV